MGIILVRIFTSSTCVTVQTLHFPGIVPLGQTAALSRNLVKQIHIELDQLHPNPLLLKQLFLDSKLRSCCLKKLACLNWLVWGISSPLEIDSRISYNSSEFCGSLLLQFFTLTNKTCKNSSKINIFAQQACKEKGRDKPQKLSTMDYLRALELDKMAFLMQ